MKTFILILILLNSYQAKSQLSGQAKIDSLLKELPKMKEDKNAVDLLQSLSYEYYSINPEEGIKYGKQGLNLAEKIGWSEGEARCYNSLGVNNAKSNFSKALEYYHKALKINEKLGNQSSIALNLGNIGGVYRNQSNYPKALEYYQKSLKIKEYLGNKSGIAKNLGNIGLTYKMQSNYPKALEYYNKALKIYEELGNKKLAAETISNIGDLYEKQLSYSKAIESFKKAVKISKKLDDKGYVAFYLGRIGYLYTMQSNYSNALKSYEEALRINESIKHEDNIAANLIMIGNIFSQKANYPEALKYFQKALKISERINNKYAIAYSLLNIGEINSSHLNKNKALEYYQKALKLFKKMNFKHGIASSYYKIGIEFSNKSNYSDALEYFQNALKIYKEIMAHNELVLVQRSIGSLYMEQFKYQKALEYYQKSLNSSKEIGSKFNIASSLESLANLNLVISQDSNYTDDLNESSVLNLKNKTNIEKSIYYSHKSLEIYNEIGAIDNKSSILEILANAYAQKGDYKNYHKYIKEHIKLKDSVYNQENINKISALEKLREDEIKQAEIEKQKAIVVEQEKREQVVIYSSIIVIFLIALILVLIINSKRKSEKLLLNILPAKIAKRLKSKEENIADDFESATTIFIDLVEFTSYAKDKRASEVVKLLNSIFHRFDDLVKKNGLEKIKTMGDGYLAVSGVPEIDKNHCKKAINFALEVRKELERFNLEMNTEINVRIGLETGPLVAGVIGSSKFIYDIWGDSVNTASRMESTGTPGKIQITENVKEELEMYNEDWDIEYRGEFEIKGKGLMKTYYIENKNLGA